MATLQRPACSPTLHPRGMACLWLLVQWSHLTLARMAKVFFIPSCPSALSVEYINHSGTSLDQANQFEGLSSLLEAQVGITQKTITVSISLPTLNDDRQALESVGSSEIPDKLCGGSSEQVDSIFSLLLIIVGLLGPMVASASRELSG